MLADPSVLYAAAVRERCVQVAEQITEQIRVQPATPERTHRLELGYRAVAAGAGAEIVTDVLYWQYQEFGTQIMRARPHVRPAIEAVRARGAT